MSSYAQAAEKTAIFAGGCFWCIEAALNDIRGVERVVSGYAGGHTDAPTYEAVCSGSTGHAEVVQVDFNETELAYADLLRIFFSLHDPTTLNRQGADVGTQYRSVIFAHDEVQAVSARAVMAELADHFDEPIVTEVTPLQRFWEAEAYHQDYYARNPRQGYCAAVISPKLAKLRQTWAHRLK